MAIERRMVCRENGLKKLNNFTLKKSVPAWIDDDGGIYFGPEHSPGFDTWSLRKHGCVKIDRLQAGLLFTWDTRYVSEAALDNIVEWAGSLQDDVMIVLKYYWGGWFTEKPLDRSAAVQKISVLKQVSGIDIARDTFIQRSELRNLDAATLPIRIGFQLWESARGEIFRIPRAKTQTFYSNTVHYRPKGYQQELMFSHVGKRHCAATTLPAEWSQSAIGKPVWWSLNDINGEFDRKVSPAYQNVLETGEPVYDKIMAVLADNSECVEPIWVTYERLLVRMNDLDGMPIVVCVAHRTNDVGLQLIGEMNQLS